MYFTGWVWAVHQRSALQVDAGWWSAWRERVGASYDPLQRARAERQVQVACTVAPSAFPHNRGQVLRDAEKRAAKRGWQDSFGHSSAKCGRAIICQELIGDAFATCTTVFLKEFCFFVCSPKHVFMFAFHIQRQLIINVQWKQWLWGHGFPFDCESRAAGWLIPCLCWNRSQCKYACHTSWRALHYFYIISNVA
jgi:hypothetical protein